MQSSALTEQSVAVPERFLKHAMVIVMGDLNGKLGSDNTLFGHEIRKHSGKHRNRNDNGGRWDGACVESCTAESFRSEMTFSFFFDACQQKC